MDRRWTFTIVSACLLLLVIFLLNFLWVGVRSLEALVISLIAAIPVLLIAWNPRQWHDIVAEKYSRGWIGRLAGIQSSIYHRIPRLAQVVVGGLVCLGVGTFLAYHIGSAGVALWVTLGIGIMLLGFISTAAYRLGYFEE